MSNVNNPYASPTEASDPFSTDASLIGGHPVASQNKRLVNYLLDQVVVRILGGLAGFALGIAYAASKVNAGQGITEADELTLNLIGFAIGAVLTIAYFFIMEQLFGVTLGKLATGTRVVNISGQKATAGQILGRTFSRIIPFEPLSFLFGDKTTGWHDSLSGTKVVDTRKTQ